MAGSHHHTAESKAALQSNYTLISMSHKKEEKHVLCIYSMAQFSRDRVNTSVRWQIVSLNNLEGNTLIHRFTTQGLNCSHF